MNKNLKSPLKFPLQTTRVKVAIMGIHYHIPDCPICNPTIKEIPNPECWYYLEIEVPKVWVEKNLDIPMFGRMYRSHIEACKNLLKRRTP